MSITFENDVSSRPRPVLVKFNCASDVVNILAKYCSLSSNAHRFFIKPDLSPVERSIESLLLKERRVLIDSGTLRKAIKVCGNCIFVNSRPHSKVINGALVFNPTLADHSSVFQCFASNDSSTSAASNCDPPPISSPASTSSANISSNDSSSSLSSQVKSDSHTSE